MIRRIMALAGLALTVAAATLALAVPASARGEAQVHLVSGDAFRGQLSGGLDGTVSETPDSFASFLATVRLTPGGILTWRWSQTFDGCVDGHCGRLFLEAHFLYRFKPGTRLYDFSGPEYQPGTTGDPDAWLSGGSVTLIRGGEGGLQGASGILVFNETVFLTAHVYGGVVRL